MAEEADSRAIFVVQRHFRIVRRGYDTDEVDRHLRLVAEWFRKSDAGRFAAEAETRLCERQALLEQHERVVAEREEEARRLVEGARIEAEATLQGAQLRANA